MRALAAQAPMFPDDTLPSKVTMRAAQQRALPKYELFVSDSISFGTPVDATVLDCDAFFRLSIEGSPILWIPEQALYVNVRLISCAYMREAGHWAVVATLVRLQAHSWSKSMVLDVKMCNTVLNAMICCQVILLVDHTAKPSIFRSPMTLFISMPSLAAVYWRRGTVRGG